MRVHLLNDRQALDHFMNRVILGSDFHLKEAPFSASDDWSIRGGALSHRTGGFFDVFGLETTAGDEHLLMYQPQSALTGLAFCWIQDQIHVLLQARIEPGNSGVGQWGPTIQSTPANFLGLHRGNPTPALELFYEFSPLALPVGTSLQLDLGERYFHKSKWHNYVLLQDPIATPDHMAWVSWKTIAGCLERDNCLNADLRSLLAVFNWEKLRKTGDVQLQKGAPNVLLDVLQRRRASSVIDYRLKGVREMREWVVLDEGIEPRENPTLASARLYHTSCGTREVKAWYQPMISAATRGRVTLQVADGYCLLQVRKEIGIDGGWVLTASEIINAGEPIPSSADDVLASFVQSDEGGRFNKHETTYRIIRGDLDAPVEAGMAWVPMASLKHALALSNVASFQLRCVASLLITEMNPMLVS